MTNLPLTFEKPYRSLSYRLINGVRTFVRSLGFPLAPLEENQLLSEAQQKAGLEDFGNGSFRVPLKILLKSLNSEAHLNFVGRTILRQYLLKLLVNRLQIQEELKRCPEITQVEIKHPLFILGLPRSGTTFLHRLLSQDPSSRWLHLWEMYNPCPSPNYETREIDPRIAEAEKLVTGFNSLAPQFPTVHYIDPNQPEECNVLFEHDFVSTLFELRANIPSYLDWLLNQDLLDSYSYYRQQLQLLSWKWSEKRWLLKAPFHLFYLSSLIAVFLDAHIIWNHRSPQKVLPSLCSLSASVRTIYTDNLNLKALGEHYLNLLTKGMEKSIQMRQTIPKQQIYDLNYLDLVSQPIDTVRKIYGYFGYEFTPTLEEKFKQYILQNPQYKYGVHRYSLEQFGLDSKEINQIFGNYITQFNVPSESTS